MYSYNIGETETYQYQEGEGGETYIRHNRNQTSEELDDGLYALAMEPVSSDDLRHLTSQIFDITPPGEYSPVSQNFVGSARVNRQIWTTMAKSTAQPPGRIFTLTGVSEF